MSDLEQEFSVKVKEARLQIDNELRLAREAFDRAVLISNNTGVPFETDIYKWETNKYIPESFSGIRTQFLKEFDPDISDEYVDDFVNSKSFSKLETILSFEPYIQDVGGYGEPLFEGWLSYGWSSSSMYC